MAQQRFGLPELEPKSNPSSARRHIGSEVAVQALEQGVGRPHPVRPWLQIQFAAGRLSLSFLWNCAAMSLPTSDAAQVFVQHSVACAP